MILLTLQMYHIPEEISKMLGKYFDGFLMQFTTKHNTTNENRLEVVFQSFQFLLIVKYLIILSKNKLFEEFLLIFTKENIRKD